MNIANFMLSCSTTEMKQIMGVVGWLVWGIKIVVPIILIIVGMIDMGKAVTGKNEDDIKKAQQALVKKAVAAVLVFLIPTLVTLIMGLVGGTEFKSCMTCVNSPWNKEEGCTLNASEVNPGN